LLHAPAFRQPGLFRSVSFPANTCGPDRRFVDSAFLLSGRAYRAVSARVPICIVMWQIDPSTLIALFLLAGVYIGASLKFGRRPTAKEGAAFVAALLTILVAITGPLDELTRERSFAVYIFQQMLLVFVVPPLLLFGLPGWMLRPLLLNRVVEPVAR